LGVDELTTTTGIAALAAGAVALIALLGVLVLARRLSRLRADQRVVFGERDARDLVAHAAELDRDFRSLHSYVEDLATGLQARLATAEERLDGAVTHTGLVRYDAYNEMSGRQSTSIALLDGRGSGVVVSSIHHRDQARLYAKQVVEGQGQLELSPEEQEAIRVALAREVPDRAEQRR
jgi:tetrahydromethanopterin S-methyltransferase subunit F